LSQYAVHKALKKLPLGSAEDAATVLVELLGQDGRVVVATLHKKLWPLVKTNSANNALQRLLKAINDAAREAGLPLVARITENKKAGAGKRFVWFEGPDEVAPQPNTPDLAAIAPGALVERPPGLLWFEGPDEAAPQPNTPDLAAVAPGALAERPPGLLLNTPIVLVTFNEHETKAVRDRFAPRAELRFKDDLPYYDLGEHGGVKVIQVISRQGEEETQATAHRVCGLFKPRALIGVGIAFGMNPAKQRMGDVLVSRDIQGYDLQRINANGTLTPRGTCRDATPSLLRRIYALDQSRLNGPQAGLGWPRVHFGRLVSGSPLVDNLDYRESLKKLYGNVIGGEMEGSGLSLPAREDGVPWIVVKAICDWGDGRKGTATKDRDQESAAANAALVVHAAIHAGGWEVEGRESEEPLPVERSGLLIKTRPETPLPPPWFKDLDSIRELIDNPDGSRRSLAKDAAPAQQERAIAQGSNAFQALLDWAHDPEGRSCLVLLGEYGMGKTISCQRLAREILERRSADQSWPVPLHFDLRHVTALRDRVPTVDEVMAECAQAGWRHNGNLDLCSVEQIRSWIGAGALIIFDGLDEALVKLSEADGTEFTRRLLSLVPADGRDGPSRPKVLISSRTQYFRTLRDERNHFTGEERGEKTSEAFESMLLLPFTDEQVTRYLRAVLPESDAERVLDTINSVHNLSELAHRPVALRFVADQIPEIEKARAQGDPIYGSTLYRMMANQWFDRDQGKHHIKRREDKLALAAALAAHLWLEATSGRGSASAEEAQLPALALEDWLHEWLEQQPRLKRRYGHLNPDLLEEDLRNTTFLRRVDLGPDKGVFRFAHTSLQEFFLSEHLVTNLRSDNPSAWEMPCPSAETLDFLGQSLVTAEDHLELLATLERWVRMPQAQVNTLILRYALRARTHEYPEPSLRGINLQGVNLRGEQLELGPLDLSGANLSGADLTDARLVDCDLSRVGFTAARLRRAHLLECSLENANFDRADLVGAVVRRANLRATSLTGSSLRDSHWIDCVSAPASLPGDPSVVLVHPGRTVPQYGATSGRLDIGGHTGPVDAVAWSPDGTSLAAGGYDDTVRLWDPATGQTTAVLKGHTNWVRAVAWSPDGTALATGGDDDTVRLWDPATGQTTAVLKGHTDWVRAVAWSPDGTALATGGDDDTVRLWDPATGQEIRRIQRFQRDNYSVWDSDGNLTLCSEGAWEYLAWLAPADADHPYGRNLPAEYFGPLPVAPDPEPVERR
jgi:nucleoside phosphorylase/uncharacterized protein YjbI with pentapeptide repeats